MIPFVAVFVLMQLNGWHSDKTGERHWHAAIPVFLAAAGALGVLGQPRSMALAIVYFTLMSLGTAYLPVFWAIPTEALSHTTGAAAVGFINAVGSIAGFAGPYLFGYLTNRTGSFSAGICLFIGFAVVGGLMLVFAPRREAASA